ncbi:MAG: hypothetical protein IT426_06390 [Pirellulales bacterium]|nr:hypothetical protein [Pirellulales bacterium]
MCVYQYLRLVAWVWIITCIGAFLSGFLFTLVSAPQWLPLPWSDFCDFVESSDGDVYVSLGFYHRVLRYDADGNFVASYPEPPGKGDELAADLQGRIFLCYKRGRERVVVFSRAWQKLADYENNSNELVSWRLDGKGEPVSEQSWETATAVDRAAKPGDYIFHRKQREDSFTCIDGSRLVRTGNHLERISCDGRVIVTYSSPWILRPFTFPWPMITGWFLIAFIKYLDYRLERLSKQFAGKSLLRLMVLDAVASAVLLTMIGGVWFAGMGLLITLNNDYLPQGSIWKYVILLPTIIWFFGGPVVFVIAWKELQKRLAKYFQYSLPSESPLRAGA